MQTQINIELRNIDPQALAQVASNHKTFYISKRIIDISFSLFALILLFPLIAIIAILIKLDSPGPVFYKQERVSVKRKTRDHITYWKRYNFKCLKFRTMKNNSDPSLHKSYVKALINNDCESMSAIQGGDTSIRKLTHDPRVTHIGRILRKTSIDEIPQFFNVIVGDMSLVGPRPAIPYEVEMYKPWYYKRLETKPGITGLWQVTARSICDFDQIVKLDIQYIETQSFWNDMKILFKTPIAVFFCKGAV